MKQEEKEAIIKYVDDQLANMCKEIEAHMDADAVSTLYEQADELLSDLEETLYSLVLIGSIESNPQGYKPKKLPQRPKNK